MNCFATSSFVITKSFLSVRLDATRTLVHAAPGNLVKGLCRHGNDVP
jgi:hypothetical protein